MTKTERILVKRRANYWIKKPYKRTDLKTLAERYLRGCKRSGLSLSEAITILRMVESNWEGR